MEDLRSFSDIRHQMQATHGFAMDGKNIYMMTEIAMNT